MPDELPVSVPVQPLPMGFLLSQQRLSVVAVGREPVVIANGS